MAHLSESSESEKGVGSALAAALEKFEPVIGLEVHVQLLTRSKIFCACSTRFGAPPNTNACPVCLGLPGALPVLNREAVVMGVKAALALNCTVNEVSIFARKNYFYPDLPKGYQISQFDRPLAEHGYIVIHVEGAEPKRIGITRAHMEEDAGKSIHDGFRDSNEKTYVDLNRSGTPLLEIVSEPDMRSPDEAYDYLTRLKQILLYVGVSDCNMEEGSLRCDANVSVRPRGQKEFGTKAEVKNLNSFRFLHKAIEYEIVRQSQLIESGERVMQESRLWNTQLNKTVGMRSKEQAHDYRYFPEPDLPPLVVSAAWREEIRKTIPELPEAKRERFINQYGLREYDAEVLTQTKELADSYEDVVNELEREFSSTITNRGIQDRELNLSRPRLAANWMMGDFLGFLKASGRELGTSNVKINALAGLLVLVIAREIYEGVSSETSDIMQQLQQYSVPPTHPDHVQPMPIPPAVPQLQERVGELNRQHDLIIAWTGGGLTPALAKKVLERMFAGGIVFATAESARKAVPNYVAVAPPLDLEKLRDNIREILAANPKQLEQYRSGKVALFGFFVGQVMKATGGQANPQKLNELLKEELK